MRRIAVLAIVLLMPSAANAQISVLGLESDSGAEKMAQWVTAALRNWVKSRRMTLGPAKDLLEVKAVFGCEREKPSCMAGIARTMKVTKLIFGKVRLRAGRYVVILKMLDMASPQNLDTVTQTISKGDATRSAVRAAAARWAAKLTKTATRGKLRIMVKPAGAMVAVDGKDVGRVPDSGTMVLDLPPGSHTVTVGKKGYPASTTRVWVRIGKTTTVRFRLRRSKTTTRPVVTPPRPVVGTPRPTPEGATPQPVKEKPKTKRSPKLWWQIAFYSSAGLAVGMLVGALATYFKYQSLEDKKVNALRAIERDTTLTPQEKQWIYDPDVCDHSPNPGVVKICNDGTKYANMTTGLQIAGYAFLAAAGALSYFAFIKKYPKEKAEPGEGAGYNGGTDLKFTLTPGLTHRGGFVNARLEF